MKTNEQAAKGHTLGPWKVLDTRDGIVIVSESHRHIATIMDSTRLEGIQDRPNAELIVRAVNSHDALLEALKSIVLYVETYGGTVTKNFDGQSDNIAYYKGLITKAEGK